MGKNRVIILIQLFIISSLYSARDLVSKELKLPDSGDISSLNNIFSLQALVIIIGLFIVTGIVYLIISKGLGQKNKVVSAETLNKEYNKIEAKISKFHKEAKGYFRLLERKEKKIDTLLSDAENVLSRLGLIIGNKERILKESDVSKQNDKPEKTFNINEKIPPFPNLKTKYIEQPKKEKEPEKNDIQKKNVTVNGELETKDSIHKKLYKLLDENKTVDEIASITGLSTGIIELLIGLRNKNTE